MDNYLKIYKELVEYDLFLQDHGTSLRKKDRNKYLEMLNYSVKLSDFIHWQKKNEYLNLIKKFVNSNINGTEFVDKFIKLYQLNEKTIKIFKRDLEKLITIDLNPNSFGFSEWISEIEIGCDEFFADFQPEDQIKFKFARDEENFRAFMADILPQIQKYCNS